MSKNTLKRHVPSLLIAEKGKGHYVHIKHFSTFMYDHTLHRGKKHSCHYCLQALSTKEILKCHINDCFRINGKQRIKMPNMLDSKIVRGKNHHVGSMQILKVF